MLDEAFACVETAVAAERAKNYLLAFTNYSEAVQSFLGNISKLPDDKAKDFIRKKCTELTAKAEEMYLYATNRHKTVEGFQSRLDIMEGTQSWQEPSVEQLEERLKALHGPAPVLATIQSETYEQNQKMLEEAECEDASGIHDLSAAVMGTISDLHMHSDEEEDLISENFDDLDTFKNETRAYIQQSMSSPHLQVGGNASTHNNANCEIDATIADVKFGLQIPKAPVGRPILNNLSSKQQNDSIKSNYALSPTDMQMASANTVEELLRIAHGISLQGTGGDNTSANNVQSNLNTTLNISSSSESSEIPTASSSEEHDDSVSDEDSKSDDYFKRANTKYSRKIKATRAKLQKVKNQYHKLHGMR